MPYVQKKRLKYGLHTDIIIRDLILASKILMRSQDKTALFKPDTFLLVNITLPWAMNKAWQTIVSQKSLFYSFPNPTYWYVVCIDVV